MGVKRHAVIAGTGRAGTSFLVRFLDACGLDTGSGDAQWFRRARAGLEHRVTSEAAPYVLKDPQLFSYLDDIDLSEVRIDALILPMRDLMAAAESRVLQERAAIAEIAPQRVNSQVVAYTPGGGLYSLDVVDQARVLAVGFHNVLHWAASNELRVLLPSFPRMVEDCEHLLASLRPWLGEHVSDATARKAFDQTAAASDVRVRKPQSSTSPQPFVLAGGEPNRAEIALDASTERLRELSIQHSELIATAEAAQRAAAQRIQQLTAELNDVTAQLASAQEQRAAITRTTAWQLRERLARHGRLHRCAGRLARMAVRDPTRISSSSVKPPTD